MTILQIQKIFIISIFIAIFFTLPQYSVRADYVFKGRTFDSYNEYANYVSAYMHAWRIAHGDESNTNNKQSTHNNKNTFTISTGLVSDISKNAARFTGNLDFDDSERVRIWFDYGKSKQLLLERTETEVLTDSKYNEKFDRKVVTLDDNTMYYYRAGGINNDGLVQYGKVRSFKTDVDTNNKDAKIRVKTAKATDIDENRATLKASVSFKREEMAYVWFEYGDDEDDLYEKTPTVRIQKSNGRYVYKTIKRLDDASIYYFRAVGEDVYGERMYGKTYSLKTQKDVPNEKPEVTTEKAQNSTSHTVDIFGSVDMNDFRNGTVFFVYGENKDDIEDVRENYSRFTRIREYGDDRQKILLDDDLDGYTSYDLTLQYLDLDTKHYFAIGVEYENEVDDEEIILGKILSFKTKRN